MKILVSITCMAILVAVGVYLYRDRQSQQRADLLNEHRRCADFKSALSRGEMPTDFSDLTTFCIMRGYLSGDEIRGATERGRQKQ